eukprot:gene3467-6896_t
MTTFERSDDAKDDLQITLSSFLLSLGPQRSFISITEEEALFPSKSIECLNLISHYSCNPFMDILSQQFNEFSKVHGSGTTSLVCLTTLLLKQMSPIKAPPGVIAIAMDSFVQIYTSTCDSLVIPSSLPSFNSSNILDKNTTPSLTNKNEEEGEITMDDDIQNLTIIHDTEMSHGDDPDDVDWFFDAPEPSASTDTSNNKSSINTKDQSIETLYQGSSIEQETSHILLWSNEWLAMGLQHCLPWEFFHRNNTNITSNNKSNNNNNNNNSTASSISSSSSSSSQCPGGSWSVLGQPMSLALTAAEETWSINGSLQTRAEKSRISLTVDGDNDNNEDKEDNLFSDVFAKEAMLSMDNIVLETVAGVSTDKSTVYPRSLVFPATSTDWRRILSTIYNSVNNNNNNTCTNSSSNNNSNNNNNNNNDTSITSRVFYEQNGVIEMCGIALIDGVLHPGDVGEGAGASQQAQAIHTTFISSSLSHISPKEMYIKEVVSSLCRLRVRLVLARQTLIGEALEDACSAAGIVIIVVRQRTLYTAAALTHAIPVQDILDLSEGHIGGGVFSLRCIPRGAVVTQERVDSDVSNLEEDVLLLLSISDGSDAIPAPVVSVIATAPTSALANDLRQRVQSSLYRIRSGILGGVMSGAGLCELLCVMQIEQLCDGSGNGDGSGSAVDPLVGALLRAIGRALEEYCLTTSRNCGQSWQEALESIVKARVGINGIMREEGSCNVFDWLQSVTPQTALRLPCPIQINMVDNHMNRHNNAHDRNKDRDAVRILDAIDIKKHDDSHFEKPFPMNISALIFFVINQICSENNLEMLYQAIRKDKATNFLVHNLISTFSLNSAIADKSTVAVNNLQIGMLMTHEVITTYHASTEKSGRYMNQFPRHYSP